MIEDITIFLVLAIGSLTAMILLSIGINLFLHPSAQQESDSFRRLGPIMKVIYFALFLIEGFSFVPIILKFFLDALVDVIPGSDIPRTLVENGMLIVYVLWFVYLAGMAFAIPAMIKSGFFEAESQTPPPEETTNI